MEDIENDHEVLYSVARTSLRTKLDEPVFAFSVVTLSLRTT